MFSQCTREPPGRAITCKVAPAGRRCDRGGALHGARVTPLPIDCRELGGSHSPPRMEETDERRVAALAATRLGLFTRDQARRAGMTDRQLDHRALRGVLERVGF